MVGSEIILKYLGSASFGCEIEHKVIDLVVNLL